jgi:hypothetical protein
MRSTLGTKPIYLRGIPAHVVREAKAIAARRGITLAGFVADAIVRAIEQQPTNGPAMPSEPVSAQAQDALAVTDDLSSEMRWFEQHRERIARERAGEYVAIIEREIVDHDADFDALARRVFAKHGLRNVFMPLVAAQAKPLRVRSPRIEAARLRQARATRAR